MIKILFAFLLIFHVSSYTPKDNSLFVYYTVTNTAQAPVRVYRPGGPLEGIFYSDYVSVKFEGKYLDRRPHYPSMDLRRLPELPRVSERAFILLNPGESVTSSVDIANQFDFTKVGTYHVEMNPSKQYEIENLLDSGKLVVEECQDYEVKQRNERRRDLKYKICGIIEDKGRIQEEFQKNFIMKPESSIELPSSLTLDRTEEQLKTEPVLLNDNDVPSFGLLGSASLVIEITSENIPHGTGLDTNFTLSYCKSDNHYENRFRIHDESLYFLSEEDIKELEKLECPGFSIWKYRKAFDNICRKVRNDVGDLVRRVEKLLNPLIKLFHEYIM